MSRWRNMIVLVLTLSITLAPIAWGSALFRSALNAASANAAMAGMMDCEKTTRAADKRSSENSSDSCCETDLACPPEYCLSKCLQLVAAIPHEQYIAPGTRLQMQPDGSEPPSDWSYRPPPPPPRT